jgi:hypothetical protein
MSRKRSPHARLSCLAAALCLTGSLAAADPNFWRNEWPKTDFTTTTVENWVEILSGGPPKDGIPAIMDPQFKPVAEEAAIAPREPVIALEIEGARHVPTRCAISPGMRS